MLTKEQNELLTQTGPDTPGGDLMRRYWQPVALSEELPAGGAPIPVRVLSEDLVLFRDEFGQPGLLETHCAHRAADLSYGRIEGGGLRCVYHGWLYDVAGRCLEQPGEPAGSEFRDKVRQPAYLCQESGGMIFAYLGPGDPPLLPQYPWLTCPAERRYATKIYQECNYLQGNEGNIDPQHLSFLHRISQDIERSPRSNGRLDTRPVMAADTAPTMEVDDTSYGHRTFAVRKTVDGRRLVRITHFIVPNVALFGGVHYHVPIDDTHHWKYLITYDRPPAEIDLERETWQQELLPGYRLARNPDNRFLQDRDEMQSGRTYIGMGANFRVHDYFATVGEGAIQDRTQEHLGATDKAIAAARRILLHAIREVQEGGEPLNVIRGAAEADFSSLAAVTEIVPGWLDWRNHWGLIDNQPAPAGD
jgi:phenylpropionate dioxygenase-like ring-hydroxylating dioxygenase large terminal subunit